MSATRSFLYVDASAWHLTPNNNSLVRVRSFYTPLSTKKPKRSWVSDIRIGLSTTFKLGLQRIYNRQKGRLSLNVERASMRMSSAGPSKNVSECCAFSHVGLHHCSLSQAALTLHLIRTQLHSNVIHITHKWPIWPVVKRH